VYFPSIKFNSVLDPPRQLDAERTTPFPLVADTGLETSADSLQTFERLPNAKMNKSGKFLRLQRVKPICFFICSIIV
jgi:hypothetical protein